MSSVPEKAIPWKKSGVAHPDFLSSALAEVLAEDTGSRMSTRISDLSTSGCYVDTINPLSDGNLVQVKIFTETHSFEAPATVVFSHTHLGMGLRFRPAKLSGRLAELASSHGLGDPPRGGSAGLRIPTDSPPAV